MILVTGGTGLIGSSLLFYLTQNKEHKVRAIYRNADTLQRVKHLFNSLSNNGEAQFAAIDWVVADLNDIPALEKAFRDVTFVFHCAGLISFKPNDFDKLIEFDPYKNEFLKSRLELAKRIKDRYPDLPISTSTNGPLSAAQSIRPVELILKDMRKNKENLHRLIELALDCCIKWVEAFTKEFGSISFSFGDPVASSSLISKKMYDEYAFPYQARLVNAVYEITGNKPVCHICGKSKELWEDLGRLNISGYSVDNVEDIGELKEVLGDKMLIIGNIAPVEVMNLGTVDDVIEAVKNCIIKAADSPKGYLLHTGCDVPIKTPLSNLEAYIYAVKKYGRNARIGRLPEGIKD